MRPLLVVLRPPMIHHALTVLHVTEATMEQLSLERLMEALQFALCLRMMRSAITDLDAQAHQPYLHGGQATLDVRAPGWTVVCSDPTWHAIATEHLDQL